MDYRFHPHARSELDDALTYYLKVNPELCICTANPAIGLIAFKDDSTFERYQRTGI